MRAKRRFHVIADLIGQFPNKVIAAEVGVREGKTSRHLLDNCNGLTLHMIDPWEVVAPDSEYAKSGDTTANMSTQQMVAMYNHCCAIAFASRQNGSTGVIHRDTSLQAVQRFDNNTLHLIFIDAIHTYNHVKQDLQLWWPKLKAGGYILVHDYGNTKYPGVRQAWDEFVRGNGLKSYIGADRLAFAPKPDDTLI